MDPQSFWQHAITVIMNRLAWAAAMRDWDEEYHPAPAPVWQQQEEYHPADVPAPAAQPMWQPEEGYQPDEVHAAAPAVEEYEPAEVPAPAHMWQEHEEYEPAAAPVWQHEQVGYDPAVAAAPVGMIRMPVLSTPPAGRSPSFRLQRSADSYDIPSRQENEVLFEVMSPFYTHHVNNENARTPTVPCYASETLYVEGLPSNCTRREVAHIFRHFSGFREVNLIKESGHAGSYCFVDFATMLEARAALETLQGYVFDEDDPSSRLRIGMTHLPDCE